MSAITQPLCGIARYSTRSTRSPFQALLTCDIGGIRYYRQVLTVIIGKLTP
jgi:hypothetical protein